MPRLPFMKFYPADYLLGTRALTDTEKAIWMDLLCYMWIKSSSRGWLDMYSEDLARMLGRDRLTIEVTLNSLKEKGICDLKNRDDQTIFVECRRMVRDQKQLNMTNKRVKRFNGVINASFNGPINASLTPKKSEVRSQNTTTPIVPKPGDEQFEKFWEAYPRKVGRGAAEKAWSKVPKGTRPDQVISAVWAQRRSLQWTKDAGQFIPHPTTWLNQRRWEDALDGAPVSDRPRPAPPRKLSPVERAYREKYEANLAEMEKRRQEKIRVVEEQMASGQQTPPWPAPFELPALKDPKVDL